MLGMIDEFRPLFKQNGIELTIPNVVQTMSVDELKEFVPQHDGWIIGDDPATREVFEAGTKGNLKAAVKWGIGVDNVDFDACKDFGIPITNTPNMFGGEVADIAVGYVVALARETFQIDDAVRKGEWPKPRGMSLYDKNVALVGMGDIGSNVARRLLAMGMNITGYDPVAKTPADLDGRIKRGDWPEGLEKADFIVVTCALSKTSKHMVNADTLDLAKDGVRIVNVGRGPVIKEKDLEAALRSQKVYSAALDVFEDEPLPMNSYLRSHPLCIFGSHNASNTADAVRRTSNLAINKLLEFLNEHQ